MFAIGLDSGGTIGSMGYRQLHDAFGVLTRSAHLSQIVKALIEIKYAQRAYPCAENL